MQAAAEGGRAPTLVPTRHPLQWVATAVVLLLLLVAIRSIATNPGFDWGAVGSYLFNHSILSGVVVTLYLTAIAMAMAVALGTLLALMRMSSNRLLLTASWVYTWLFRSVPVLVQLIVWYNLAALYPHISVSIPFGPMIIRASTNHVITRLVAAILGLGLAQAAYTGEVIRGGFLSVSRGQHEAAQALGMKRLQAFRRVILPQAMRLIVPPMGNEVVGLLKNTSLVSVIALAELLYSAQLIYANNFETIPLLIVASIWYIVIVSVLSLGQYYLERHYRRGVR